MDVLSTIVFDVMDRALRCFAKLVHSARHIGLVRAKVAVCIDTVIVGSDGWKFGLS
jgi:hypothetical protein